MTEWVLILLIWGDRSMTSQHIAGFGSQSECAAAGAQFKRDATLSHPYWGPRIVGTCVQRSGRKLVPREVE